MQTMNLGPGWVRIPESTWPKAEGRRPVAAYKDLAFLVQVYEEDHGHTRLSICRCQRNKKGEWLDGITWDDLQYCKRSIGMGDEWAVEVYPPDDDTVNVANMRHLWIMPEKPAFGWTRLNRGE